jgi:hypothetical protein
MRGAVLQEFCQKQKLPKASLSSEEQKGGTGFKGKVFLPPKEDNAPPQIRYTDEVYAVSVPT